jgi:hypothetical protein
VPSTQDTEPTPVPTAEDPDDWDRKVHAHRRRQESVAAILDQTFGQLPKCSPDLWERWAYLMLVGLLYERLATNEAELSTDELVALSKALAENRRAEARLRDNHRPKEAAGDATAPSHKLPSQFADIVRQVYGTNFQAPTDALGAGDGAASVQPVETFSPPRADPA